MRSLGRAFFAVSLFVWLVSVCVAQSTYSFTDLTNLGGTYSDARGVNNSGQVTGCSTTSSGATHAYVWSPTVPLNGYMTVITDLGTLLPGGTYSCGVAINDSGQVTGYSDVNGSGGNAHAFLYSPSNGMADLGTLSADVSGTVYTGQFSYGLGINNDGFVTGYSDTEDTSANETSHAFVSRPVLPMFDLGTPSGYDMSFGTGINSSEAVVGYSLPGPLGSATFVDGFVGFCCNTSDPVAIGSLGVGGATHAFGINNSGYVTGISNTICCGAYAFLWTSSGGMTSLGGLSNCTFQNIYSIGYAINASGQITGWSALCSGAQHHFLYSQGTMTDLNYALPAGYVDYIDPNDEEAGTGIRFSINDNGQITGTASYNGVCCHAYLLSLGPLGNTPAGSSVAVQPSSVVSMTFNTVTAGGNTTVTTSATGPNPPAGFELGSPATYYNISTTATFSGLVTVCINYAGTVFASSPQLFHFNGTSWVNVTTSVNTTTSTVCGIVSSLSPFALFSPPKYKVCLLYDPTKGEKPGRTLPIKLQLCDGSGKDQSSSSVVVHAVSLTQVSTATSGVVVDSGSANPDNDFRFDSSLGSTGGYIFNLSTKGLATGTYNLNFTVTGDSFVYAAPFQVN